MDPWKLARNGYLILAVVFYALGVFYIFAPDISPLVVCRLSGVVLIAYGVIKVVGYFSQDLYCLAFEYDFACGLLLIALGVIVLCRQRRVIPYLSTGLGLLILLESVFTIQMSLDARRFGLERWQVILGVSLAAGVLGALLLIRPYQSGRIAHVAAGCALLAEGAKNHCVICRTAIAREPPADEPEGA